jgi:uncharacterized protein YjiS (DUF1127 family)
MFAVNPGKDDRPIGQVANYSGAFLWLLLAMADRLDPRRFFRLFRDDAQRNETIRELNLLSDHYLDDAGARRSADRRADDLVNRLRLGG